MVVQDSGIGVAEEDIPKALAPFSQIEDDLSRSYEGAGLGLPLAVAMTELHGGELTVESAKARGTTVTVAFPRVRVILPSSVAV